ncbi:unnamed protein product, partial [Anisakis simplex]|uniref:Lysophospholipase n=1 Tax=Anisakis simplex TaxID=6269 RepID=A0A0M3K1C8_ANISI
SSSQEDEDEGEQDADNIEEDRLKSVTLSASNKDLDVVPSQIENSFVNRRTFSCPRAHPTLHTGDSTADLSPEDIDIIGALGDSLATGKGLWPGTDIEFRGASFPIGGDATIDGLVTVPNILLEFNERVFGVSHGMGQRSELPDDQFNCAESGAKTGNIPEQVGSLMING